MEEEEPEEEVELEELTKAEEAAEAPIGPAPWFSGSGSGPGRASEEPEATERVEPMPEPVAEVEPEEVELPETIAEEAPAIKGEEPKELRVEEEAEAEEQPPTAPREVPKAPGPPAGGWELFGHLVIEDRARRGRVSIMRCVRCGAEAQIIALKALKERPCTNATPTPNQTVRCSLCGRETTLPEGAAPICDECDGIATKYCLSARPVLPLPDRWVSVKPPVRPGVEWAWVKEVWTFFPSFTQEGRRVWACPKCGKAYHRLSDVVHHFRDHVWEANHGIQKKYLIGAGEVYALWQGLACPGCGLLVGSEDALRSHQCMGSDEVVRGFEGRRK
ncbi:MAG: hypothetical protein QXP81_08670 [Nitrososphaerota archaeon]